MREERVERLEDVGRVSEVVVRIARVVRRPKGEEERAEAVEIGACRDRLGPGHEQRGLEHD